MTSTLSNPDFQVTDLVAVRAFREQSTVARAEVDPLPVLRRMAHLLTRAPGDALKHLAETAQELCHGDAAGICLEEKPIVAGSEGGSVRVLAATGTFRGMAGIEVPQADSACAVAIEQQRAQHFQFPLRFFAEIDAAMRVTDGITVPWSYGTTRGTVWVLTHDPARTFGPEDDRLLTTLADFAAIAHRNLRQQEAMRRETSAIASSAMAHTLAHHINNPLQSITNSIYLALYGSDADSQRRHLEQASDDLRNLSQLVGDLLLLHRPLRQDNMLQPAS